MDRVFSTESRMCKLSLPLLLRLFEYIREENTTDEDLHFMAERISQLAWDGVAMSMNEYQSIIPKKDPTMVSRANNYRSFESTHEE